MKLYTALIGSLFLVSACSFQQNPLDGVSGQVNDGTRPDTNKPIAEKPLDKMNLQIDSPRDVRTAVGNEVKFKITGRVLTAGVDFQLYFDNLALFPGATYDPVTNDFRWTPTAEILGSDYITELPLSVTIVTIPEPGRIASSENKIITISISKKFSKPTIKSLGGVDKVIGGYSYNLPFALTDLDARGKGDITIVGKPCGIKRSLTAYINLYTYGLRDLGKGEFEGEVTLDLSQAPNLSQGSYCIGLAAVSAQGKVSDIYEKNFEYDPKVQSSLWTITEPVSISVGEVKRINFAIFDPAGAGVMSVTKMSDISANMPGSSWTCAVNKADNALINCEAIIDATMAKPGRNEVMIGVSTASRKMVQNKSNTHTLVINVKAVTP